MIAVPLFVWMLPLGHCAVPVHFAASQEVTDTPDDPDFLPSAGRGGFAPGAASRSLPLDHAHSDHHVTEALNEGCQGSEQ